MSIYPGRFSLDHPLGVVMCVGFLEDPIGLFFSEGLVPFPILSSGVPRVSQPLLVYYVPPVPAVLVYGLVWFF